MKLDGDFIPVVPVASFVGLVGVLRLYRVDHLGIFTMNDPPGEASHSTPLINKTGEIESTGITPFLSA